MCVRNEIHRRDEPEIACGSHGWLTVRNPRKQLKRNIPTKTALALEGRDVEEQKRVDVESLEAIVADHRMRQVGVHEVNKDCER